MKKTLLYSLFALSISSVILLTSCEDAFGNFLDKQPSNELTEEEVFSDWTLMEEFHYDTYNFLRHGACRIKDSWLDATTDLAQTSYSSGGVRTSFNIGNYYSSAGESELTGTWEHYYRGIRKCNMIITRIEKVPKEPSLSETQYEQDKLNYTSEARFLRAFFYWELFLRYGPIPLVTEVLDPDGDLLSNYTTRPTVKEYVVDFILKELNECETGLMNYDDAWNSSRAGRIGQPMARALYSRIMLYMASPRYSAESGITWQEAADAAKSFIDDYGSHFSLFKVADANGKPLGVEAYTNALLRTAYSGNNKEVIFYRNDVVIRWDAIKNDSPVGEGGNGGLCPSQNLVDMYDMADGSSPFTQYDATGAPVYKGNPATPEINTASGYSEANPWTNRDPRLSATVLYNGAKWGNGTINVVLGQRDNPIGNTNATPTGYYVRKYIPETILSAEHSQSAYRLWTIIRYAEILLNYAEALNEAQGPTAEVYNMLDQIRHRAGISGNIANRNDLTSSKDNMRNFIHKERTIELAFEEHRAWDIRRWDVAVEVMTRPIYGVNVSTDGTITRKIAQNRVFEKKMYLYPIPEGEVWKTGIENNPGW
ncbi:RagB/SusD family nutrient uptake outer membrane protein [Dysgonomonas sp. Marseille-P4677]|uniref:RagB/SusD family nutrient uptake outer membrane protein n=1 Tax=Dysgonomonas sp. Marseille-P4677 TaxID=2364790 RepID=UPI001911CE26|nr:RagB/SusD family nutrient uptake outer membrane protein [Dysgonomonas sp. Marseille-P4677]MBK5720957.1 RagB/SusD family nutrient uptake outer membrane protein [Dysgonomonas sp. Marseille-P4677]